MRKIPVRIIVFILSVVASIIGSATILPFINPILSAIFILSLIAAVYQEKTGKQFENRTVLNIVSILGSVFFLSKLSLNNLITPIAETLTFLLSVKLIEKKDVRDFYQIFALSLFLFTASSIFLLNIKFLFLFILEAIIIITGTVLLTFLKENRKLKLSTKELTKILSFSIIFITVAIPLTIFFFIILPRTQAPLFNLIPQQKRVITGFSNSINLGGVSEIQESNTIFMRVSVKKLEKPPYFRSITFEKFFKNRWIHIKTERKKITIKGEKIYQTVILEPYGDKYLPLINIPYQISQIKAKREGSFFVYPKPVTKRVRYTGVSVLTNEIEEPLTEKEKKLYLSLPPMPEIEKFVKERFKNTPENQLPQEILKLFQKEYRYTLKGLPVSLKDFLLNVKKGNCEYFASAAAVIFRLKGIPARLVGGFYSGEYNPYGNYYLIMGKNAHVWVEYYRNGKWHHFEPTFAAGQETIQGTGEQTAQAVAQKKKSLKEKLFLLMDTLNYYFISTVINYDFTTQIKTFSKLRTSFSTFKKLPDLNVKSLLSKEETIYTATLLLLFVTLIILMKNRKTVVEEFYETLEKKGYVRQGNEPLETFVKRIDDKNLREKALEFVRIYQESFYRDEPICCKTLENLRNIIKEIKKGGEDGPAS
ncbi:transglutaminaseTgpA domain-containing protein [Desulfurobacterium atlanticum]|uniref:Transglutaminase-like superfamily protein n=1 Tax=Desulfurobacterium atlanticum TaxID=240169 RepID=A0A238ZZ70_9BACT|nr:transglutaminase domain-containing protein [Desulfurobacterium atlanticum]SNR87943.1 Transglutaminase-like superfamily protein [Desulfurobacterium atlanticum]